MARTARLPQSTVEERLNEQSRRIKMLEEVFVPMAKTAMEIIAGKPGEPGMAEDLRNVRADLKELVEAHSKDTEETLRVRSDGFRRIGDLETWRKQQEDTGKADKEVKLMGMKVSSETRIAIINGLFILLSGFVSWVLSR